jgi:hypothetical protein
LENTWIKSIVIARGFSPVAIQTAFPFASAPWKTEPPHGLPHRCAPRNDDDLILVFPELLTAE